MTREPKFQIGEKVAIHSWFTGTKFAVVLAISLTAMHFYEYEVKITSRNNRWYKTGERVWMMENSLSKR